MWQLVGVWVQLVRVVWRAGGGRKILNLKSQIRIQNRMTRVVAQGHGWVGVVKSDPELKNIIPTSSVVLAANLVGYVSTLLVVNVHIFVMSQGRFCLSQRSAITNCDF